MHFPNQSAGFRGSAAHKNSNVPHWLPKILGLPELSEGPALASGPYPRDSDELSGNRARAVLKSTHSIPGTETSGSSCSLGIQSGVTADRKGSDVRYAPHNMSLMTTSS